MAENTPVLTDKPQQNKKTLSKATKKKLKKWAKRIVIVLLAVAVIGVYINKKNGDEALTSISSYSLAKVERRDITVTLDGSATVLPKDSYTLTSLVSGEILSDSFGENEYVEKDQLLYVIDSSDVTNSISKAELGLQKARLSYNEMLENFENLNVKTKIGGTVTKVYVEKDSSVQMNGMIADIVDDSKMLIELPFNSFDVDNMYVGQPVSLTVESNFETISGKIKSISGLSTVGAGNVSTKNVEIEVVNPGALTEGISATAKIGSVYSLSSSQFKYYDKQTVTAKSSGDVVNLNIKVGDKVKSGQTLVKLQNTALENQVKSSSLSLNDSQLSLENTYDRLENYNITSPISGTVVQKNFKAGESVSENTLLAIIYDMSTLKFDLAVDELDIAQIKVGQEVKVTAEAINDVITGYVTKVSIVGTTSNGVTTYPVTVEIAEPKALLPGMNVEASIILDKREDVLAVPVNAVSRGNTVLKFNGGDENNLTENSFTTTTVTLGINDDKYIEVESGLNEGDTIGIFTKIKAAAKATMEDMMSGGGGGGNTQTVTVTSNGGPSSSGGNRSGSGSQGSGAYRSGSGSQGGGNYR